MYPFYINRLSPSAGKRNHNTAFQYTWNFLQYLETFGARVLNGAHTVPLETSKAFQATLLKKLGINHPKTLVFNDFSQILGHINKFSFPVLLKPNCGGSGMGITLFNNKNELIEAVEKNKLELPPEQLMVMQEYHPPKEGYIVRVEVIGKKIAYAMKVFTGSTFNLCPSDSCDISRNDDETSLGYCAADNSTSVRFELQEKIPDDIAKAIAKIVKEARLECAGVEYVIDKNDNWFIYDVNALSILRSSFKEEHGIDGWGMLADYFIKEYEKVL